MKYLYITLYYFYTKVLSVQNDYPPIISITAVLSILLIHIIMVLIEIFNLVYLYGHGFFLAEILSVMYLTMWYLLYRFYMPKEKAILENYEKKPRMLKVVIRASCFFLIIVIVLVWFNRFSIFRD
jgi:hypothetical protein